MVAEGFAAPGLRRKTAAEVGAIVAALRSGLEALYAERLRGLHLFGSYARGEATASSDIDVLVVLDSVESSWNEIKRTSRLRASVSLENDVSVNTIFVCENDWRDASTDFLRGVRKRGV